MSEIFGIDLGTTNSCISVIDDSGLPLVMKNLDDEFTTPSVVYFDEVGDVLVGREGKNSMGKDPNQTVAFIKREMSNTAYSRKINGEIINPVKISSMIIKKLIDDANTLREDEGKRKIHKAVITVPAYFGSMERDNTKQAGKLAGLQVLDLLNEPTAAALSYGAKGLNNKTFLIYDLGGGTFDVSVMSMRNGVMDTLATEGNHKLGGVDWDITLVDFGLMQAGFDETYEDIKDSQESGKMMLAAEICKKKLSETEEATFKFLYQRKNHLVKIKRSVFEELTADLVQQTLDLLNKAIEAAKVKANNRSLKIDEFILVGGSSYMPMIKKKLQLVYPSTNIRLDRFEPDLAIAKGAAIYAAQLEGDGGNVKLGQDMGSRSYGTSCLSRDDKSVTIVTNLILKTDPMVVKKTQTFYTASEDQKSTRIDIYENEGLDEELPFNKCVLMKDAPLDWGTPVPKGTSVVISFDRGSDGVLKVYGECEGKTVQFEIKPKLALSDDEAAAWQETLSNETF